MRDVFLNGQIGLHRPRFDYGPYGSIPKDQARAAYNALIAKCVDFMKEMGISERVFSDMLKVPSQRVRFVYREATLIVDLILLSSTRVAVQEE